MKLPSLPVLLAGLVLTVAMPAVAQQAPASTGANFDVRLAGVEDQMRALGGRVEQVEFAIKRLDQAMQRLQGDVDTRLAKIESAPQPAVAVPSTPPPPPASASVPATTSNIAANMSVEDNEPATPAAPVNGSLGAIKMQDGKVTGAVNNPQAPPLPPTPPDYALTAQEQYDRAFELLRQANYDEAGTAFKTFIEKNPQDKLIDNAKYWYGETLYVRGKFDGAAVAFADAYQQNPQGTKAPDSLLKLAMSLENLDKTADACTTLESLKSKYPNATLNIRQRADQERTKLKCSAAAAPARH